MTKLPHEIAAILGPVSIAKSVVVATNNAQSYMRK